MKHKDRFTTVSFFISMLSLAIAIVSGFTGAKLASLVSLWIIVVCWVIWVTIKILRFENELLSKKRESELLIRKGADKELNPRNSIPNLLPYHPKFHFLDNAPIRIDQPTKKVKIPPDFLTWDRFTIIFWVKITDDFFNSYNNRYLFSYTTDSITRKNEDNYPNAFFLGILGGKLDWRFIIKGNDPKKETKITFSSHEGLKGWKMFSVRWYSSNRKLRLSIDAGKVYNNSKIIDTEFWPVSSPDHLFHLGGWDDNWLGGISMLNFFNYRIYDYHFTDGELQDCYDAEKPELNIVKNS